MPEPDWKARAIEKVLDSVPLFLIIVGVIFVLLGLAKGGPKEWFPMPDIGTRAVSGLFGLALLLLGFWDGRRTRSDIPSESKFKAEIYSPTKDAYVESRVDVVTGKIPGVAPTGYSWKVLRGYPGGGVIPVARALDINYETGRWEVRNFEIGGEPGIQDRRSIEIWLVGRDGDALLECWQRNHLVHKKAMEQIKQLTGNYGEWLEPITMKTKDMVRCAHVDVFRK